MLVPQGELAPAGSGYDGLGGRLRARREEVALSLRELARRVGVSASLISQIETGKVKPSVSTLYALVTELGGSFDQVLFGEPPLPATRSTDPAVAPPLDLLSTILTHPRGAAVQRGNDRKAIQLNAGVRWERLTSHSVPGVEFLFVVYEPGAESGPPDEFQRHSGREWCYVISGTLDLVVGFDEHRLTDGDAITYDATMPHRLSNPSDEPLEMIWFQLG